MKDIHEVLQAKEAELNRVESELVSLRLAISLLEETQDKQPQPKAEQPKTPWP